MTKVRLIFPEHVQYVIAALIIGMAEMEPTIESRGGREPVGAAQATQTSSQQGQERPVRPTYQNNVSIWNASDDGKRKRTSLNN